MNKSFIPIWKRPNSTMLGEHYQLYNDGASNNYIAKKIVYERKGKSHIDTHFVVFESSGKERYNKYVTLYEQQTDL